MTASVYCLFLLFFFDRQRNGSLAPSPRLLAPGRHRQAWLRSMAGHAERRVLHDPQRTVQGRPGQGELPGDEEQILGTSVQVARAGSRDRGAATEGRLPQPHAGFELSNDDSECQASNPTHFCSLGVLSSVTWGSLVRIQYLLHTLCIKNKLLFWVWIWWLRVNVMECISYNHVIVDALLVTLGVSGVWNDVNVL